MADDVGIYVPIEPDATVAADDISGIHYQRMKVVIGANGTNDGDVAAANPMPVFVRRASDYAVAVVAMTAAEALIIAANTTAVGTAGSRIWVIIENAGNENIAIGKTGLSYAASSLIIEPGGNTPPMPCTAAFYGICDTAKTSAARYIELRE